MSARNPLAVAAAFCVALIALRAEAIINQVDGTIVPQETRLQACLDKSATASGTNPAPGEGAGVLDAIRNAAVQPQVFLPATRSDGRRVVTFTMIGEGAGFQNRFGWYNVGDAPFAASSRNEVFDCRGTAVVCDCPCNGGPRPSMRSDSACTHWLNPDIVEIDFDCHRTAGRWRGGPVAFYIMTPEQVDGTRDACAPVGSSIHRVYSTDNTINDDGDYVHYLIYPSRTFANSYYFGFEDLFRGGDNDFEDVLVRAVGLVPTCNPSPEVCDGRDNNCNGLIDDGLGESTCGVGACRVTRPNCQGGRIVACTPGTPTTETCNNLDDNCNGMIDEGLTRACSTACGPGTQYCSAGAWGDCVGVTASPEVCDGMDNDCNGMIDEGLTRPCSTSCGGGIETCTMGMFRGCTAPTAMPETCNGLDDNCNGLIDDGIAPRPCRSACGPGTETCIGGTFVCNAPTARPEVCDGLDNDCDGVVDDGVPDGGTCGTSAGTCRAGRFVCTGGRYVCMGATMGGGPETCNGMDDNCNGVVDEGDPGGGASCMMAPSGARLCTAGTLHCVGGTVRCVGGTTGTPEVCNCRDDNCDGRMDEAPAGASLCPGAGRCIACQCRTPCLPGEFPCSPGLVCNADNFCVPPLCGTEICTDAQTCMNGRCVDQCAAMTCPTGQVCRVQDNRARCVENNCYGLGCTGAQICLGGSCLNNPCVGRTCPSGQFCRPSADGTAQCVGSCGNTRCPIGQSCRDGVCQRDACSGFSCASGQVCRVQNGAPRCILDPCMNIGARPGRVCIDGRLVDDPCTGVTCPGAPRVQCSRGQCIDPQLLPLERDRVVAFGGDCDASPWGSHTDGRAVVLVLLLLALSRVRAKGRRALAALGSVGALAGCESEPYCLNCGPVDAAVFDVRDVAPIEVGNPDACRVSNGGTEICDGRDNNCNGRVDEGFETATDPRNCGRCGNVCALSHAIASCAMGTCGVGRCDIGYQDLNRNAADGCEYACTPTGTTEACDGVDNDCNGLIDEGFDTRTDALNCGRCGVACLYDHAAASCVAGMCRIGACAMGFVDVDRNPANGCEYTCTPSGPEVCDGRDNDCNGTTDDGVNLMTDPRNCGACGRTCVTPHGTPACTAGACAVGTCEPGYADLDRDPSTGCEWQCGAAGGARGPEVCDGRDNDCNGLVDDGAVAMVGTACGPSERGVCRRGLNVCDRGTLRCVGATMPGVEFCNGLDDDCDGTVDNPPAGGSLPGTGPMTRCGTDVGACTFGRFDCVMGRVQCAGATTPAAEVCDGLDNNCNGLIDEMVTPPSTLRCNSRGPETQGVCATATRVCRGTAGWGCTYPSTYRDLTAEALCDGLDNNCDGRLDEGCLTAFPSADVRLDRGAGNSIQPSISGNGSSTVGVAYIDLRNGQSDIYFARSTSNGGAWDADLRLDTDTAGSRDSVTPALTWRLGASDATVGWSDFRTSNNYRDTFATSSQGTNGSTWLTPDRRVNNGQTTDSFNTHVVYVGSNVLAVWESLLSGRARHVFSALSTDRGASFSAVQQIDHGPAGAVASTPDVAVGAGARVFVVWRDNRNGATDIYFHASTDGGASWPGADTRMDTDPAGSHASEAPSVDADTAGNVYVAWQEVRSGMAFDIYANRSTDHGGSFLSSDRRVDTDMFPHDSFAPVVMALPAGDVAVVWLDLRWGLANLYASRSSDAGVTWLAQDVPVEGGAPGRSRASEFAAGASGDTVFAVWSDTRNGALDIYANYSLDGAGIFQPNDVRVDTSAAGSSDSEYPTLFVTTSTDPDRHGIAHVAWVDRRADGVTGDIYYRSIR